MLKHKTLSTFAFVQELFNTHIEKKFPELKTSAFLLACSGGVDSVVLAHLCSYAKLDFELAHCNFNLRGEESKNDLYFVEKLAFSLDVKINTINFNTKDYVELHKVSIQVAARELRYDWFAKIQEEKGLPYLVTAHHADDDLETFIINLSRGTGIDGLKGMPYATKTLKRPLLYFSQEQVLAFAQEKNIEWREDKSNADTKYLRNKIRHQIVPLLKELHPSFLENFSKTQSFLEETAIISTTAIKKVKEELFFKENGITMVSIAALRNLNPIKAYVYGIFKTYGFREWENVIDLLTAMSGKEIKSKSHRLVKDRDFLLLTPITPNVSRHYTILESSSVIKEPVRIEINIVRIMKEVSANVVYIDKEKLKFPLTLRKWKKGDYFYPFGMRGKKKLAKFFKDEKLSVLSKESQWLLCSDNQIVWVIGKRADNRFKVTSETKNILKFNLVL